MPDTRRAASLLTGVAGVLAALALAARLLDQAGDPVYPLGPFAIGLGVAAAVVALAGAVGVAVNPPGRCWAAVGAGLRPGAGDVRGGKRWDLRPSPYRRRRVPPGPPARQGRWAGRARGERRRHGRGAGRRPAGVVTGAPRGLPSGRGGALQRALLVVAGRGLGHQQSRRHGRGDDHGRRPHLPLPVPGRSAGRVPARLSTLAPRARAASHRWRSAMRARRSPHRTNDSTAAPWPDDRILA